MKTIDDYNYNEWERTQQKFREDYARSLKYNKTFQELIVGIFKEKHIDRESFVRNTELEPAMFSRIKKKGYIPSMRVLISVCIGLDLDILMTLTLLDSLAVGFKRTNEVHYAYSYLITNFRGRSIDDCNKILEKLQIEEKHFLGTHQRK